MNTEPSREMSNLLDFTRGKKIALKVLVVLIPVLYFLLPMKSAPFNITLLLVVIGFIFTINRSYWNISDWPLPQKLLSLLFLIVILGCLYSPATWDWMALHLQKYGKFAYAVALMLFLRNNPALLKRAHNAFVLSMLFILASTWLNVWFLLPWSTTQSLGFGVTHHVFGDYITQNVLMSYFVAYAAIRVSRTQTHIRNLTWLSLAVLGLLSITHLSQGRTGFLMVSIALAAVLIVRVKIKHLLLLVPVLLAVLVAILSSSDILRGRFDQGFQEFAQRNNDNFSSIGHRLYNYKITPHLIAQKPIIGHGTGAYHKEICKVVDKPEWCPTYSWHPHNQFLFFGADHGFIGMLVYLALILSLFRLAFQARNSKPGMQLIAFTSILFADSMINSPLWSSRESQFFCFLMALLVCMCNQIRQQRLDDVKAGWQIA